MSLRLDDYVRRSALEFGESVAVQERDRATSYRELDELADRCAHHFASLGVKAGDRICLWLDKSAWTVALMQAALRVGAAYVPLDPRNPPPRVQLLIREASPRVIVASRTHLEALTLPSGTLAWAQEDAELAVVSEPYPRLNVEPDQLAYILFTSGSTGTPKGVAISHRNACAFVDWAACELQLSPEDRLANHAPFHFDLSVLDIYGAFRSGASVHLIPEVMSFVPSSLTELLREHEISVLYVVPSILSLMIDEGGLLQMPAIRCVVFAGEPFSIAHLRKLASHWSESQFFNFYGPTETNVCLFHKVTDEDLTRPRPVPIGRASCGDEVWAIRADGELAGIGEEGELLVRGPTVMLGYFGETLEPNRIHHTGDIVQLRADGGYEYVGRRDQMVKLRGQRVELGEVEAAINSFPGVQRCATCVSKEDGKGGALHAFVVVEGEAPSPLALRKHLARLLPPAWMLDRVHWVETLPLTANGKLDRKAVSLELLGNRK